MQWRRGMLVFALTLSAAALIAGCGGSGSSSSSQAVVEPSKQFHDPEGPEGKEPVATFGKESGESERREASDVLAENLTAREDADFDAQCATLGKRGMEAVVGKGKAGALGDGSQCKAELEKVAKPLSKTKAVRTDTLTGEIAALRVKGNQAYALYHGNDKVDYAMPMELEGGEWKVGAILTIELPKTEPKSKAKSKPQKENKGET